MIFLPAPAGASSPSSLQSTTDDAPLSSVDNQRRAPLTTDVHVYSISFINTIPRTVGRTGEGGGVIFVVVSTAVAVDEREMRELVRPGD